MIALLKLTLIFIGIVALLSRKWNLGLTLTLASFAAALLFDYPLGAAAQDALRTTVDLLTLRLALVVVLIMTLGEMLRQTASMKGMVEALEALIANGRIVIAALPALIGFLPMVGGAMFSAPMVNEVGDHLKVNEARKTFVNYWFRHIWEPVFPIYPSMMLGAALLGLTTTQLASASWPLVIASVLGGLFFGLWGLPRKGLAPAKSTTRAQNLKTLTASIWPIALVIVLSLTLPIPEELTLVVSLIVTIGLMMAIKHIKPGEIWAIWRDRIPWQTVVVIFGALIFRSVLESSGAVQAVSSALTDLRVPVIAVTFGAPFIAGLLTGLMAAAFSIGFPVVMPLVMSNGGLTPGWTIWLFAGGFVGTMLSPVHLCLALTRVYFKAEWGPVYRLLAPAALVTTMAAAGVLLLRG